MQRICIAVAFLEASDSTVPLVGDALHSRRSRFLVVSLSLSFIAPIVVECGASAPLLPFLKLLI